MKRFHDTREIFDALRNLSIREHGLLEQHQYFTYEFCFDKEGDVLGVTVEKERHREVNTALENECPVCHGTEIKTGRLAHEANSEQITSVRKCNCGTTWTNVYGFTGHRDIIVPEED